MVCFVCSTFDHSYVDCVDFAKATNDKRKKVAHDAVICFRCFNPGCWDILLQELKVNGTVGTIKCQGEAVLKCPGGGTQGCVHSRLVCPWKVHQQGVTQVEVEDQQKLFGDRTMMFTIKTKGGHMKLPKSTVAFDVRTGGVLNREVLKESGRILERESGEV